MPRKPRKIKNSEDIVRISILLPVDDVRAIDEAAARRKDEDAYGRTFTRSDMVRFAVHRFIGGNAPVKP